VKDSLETIPRTNTDQVLNYYKKRILVSDLNLKEGQLAQYSADINDFVRD